MMRCIQEQRDTTRAKGSTGTVVKKISSMSSKSEININTQSINNNNTTSIEVTSKDGPIPINLMMQEGVKALTKILSNQLQDRKSFENAEHSMQFVIRNNSNKKLKDLSINESNDYGIEDEDIVEMDNQSNYHVHSPRDGTEIVINGDMNTFLDSEFADPELHINGNEAEIIFDYEHDDLTDVPEGISKKISEMIESVLPGSLSTDVHGRLHAVVNGDELNIIEEIDSDDELNNTGDDRRHNLLPHGQFDSMMDDERGEDPGERAGMFDTHTRIDNKGDDDEDEEYFDHEDGYCPHHHHHHHHHGQEEPSKFKNYNYHNFDYTLNKGKVPDFSVLIEPKKPMCMFCEYYMVFGEPPKNMIKWYNNAFGYNRLPMNGSNKNNNGGDHRNQHNHTEQQQQQQQGGRRKRSH